MDIFNQIAGKVEKEKPKTYSVYVQFDNDKEILFVEAIEFGKSLFIEINPNEKEGNSIEFTCETTKKKFKLFCK